MFCYLEKAARLAEDSIDSYQLPVEIIALGREKADFSTLNSFLTAVRKLKSEVYVNAIAVYCS